MNVYRSFEEAERNPKTVLTVGTFDGVHRGHMIVINRLLEIAKNENLRPVLLTIDPHPQIVLTKTDKPRIKLLTSIEERIELFQRAGLENILVIPFSEEFAKTDPEVFVREFLYEKLGIKKMLIGYDHMFGRDRSGNIKLLNDLKHELDFEVERINALQDNSRIVSSTKIREAVSHNRIEVANSMLGYDYLVSGKVSLGDRRGNTIGYPTANVIPENPYKLMPANGVYFVSSIIEGKRVFGMANLGTRPTFTDDKQAILEVHFLDFNKDIYDINLTIEFHRFIRYEVKFDGLDKLLDQLSKDKEEVIKLIKESKLK